MTNRFILLARMVKFEHSIFALPFAYIGAFIAADGWPGWRVFILLTVAMVMVRSFAMAVNRLADLKYDRLNPRTQGRPLVTGEITPVSALLFCLVTAGIFLLVCAGMNSLCLSLAPVALGWSAFYSFTKRYTWACHFVLGSVLGLAPVAGWIAVNPVITPAAGLFLLGVTFWVAGFDILYACQDVAFDVEHGLRSIPVRFGIPMALNISSFAHVNTALFFLVAGWSAGLGSIYFVFWAGISAVLLLEHRFIAPDDLSRINMVFFTMNGFVAMALFLGVLLDLIG